MATHSSVLAWRIPGTGEPSGLLSTGSHRVGHDWSDAAAAARPPPLLPIQHHFWLLPPQGNHSVPSLHLLILKCGHKHLEIQGTSKQSPSPNSSFHNSENKKPKKLSHFILTTKWLSVSTKTWFLDFYFECSPTFSLTNFRNHVKLNQKRKKSPQFTIDSTTSLNKGIKFMFWFIQHNAKTYNWFNQQIREENQWNQLFALA